jgi:hypothetical protein
LYFDYPAPFQMRSDYILSLRQPTFSRWTAHRLESPVLGCGLPISFRASISILPYHESLPVPRGPSPSSLGWNCFRVFPQFDDFLPEVLSDTMAKGASHSPFFTSYPSQKLSFQTYIINNFHYCLDYTFNFTFYLRFYYYFFLYWVRFNCLLNPLWSWTRIKVINLFKHFS